MKLYETLLNYRQRAAASGTGCIPVSIEFLNEVDLHMRIAALESEVVKFTSTNSRVIKLLASLQSEMNVGAVELKCNDYYWREIKAVLAQLS